MNRLLAIVAVAVVIGAALPAADGLAKDTRPRAPEPASQPAAPAGSPCVDAGGRWVNWPWANVPTLSPPCQAPAPAKK